MQAQAERVDRLQRVVVQVGGEAVPFGLDLDLRLEMQSDLLGGAVLGDVARAALQRFMQ